MMIFHCHVSFQGGNLTTLVSSSHQFLPGPRVNWPTPAAVVPCWKDIWSRQIPMASCNLAAEGGKSVNFSKILWVHVICKYYIYIYMICMYMFTNSCLHLSSSFIHFFIHSFSHSAKSSQVKSVIISLLIPLFHPNFLRHFLGEVHPINGCFWFP